eukprot:Opistho-1_new@18754
MPDTRSMPAAFAQSLLRRSVCSAMVLLFGAGAWAQTPPTSPPRVRVMLEEFPPYSFTDARGKPSGYSVELAQELLKRAKVEGRFEFSSWPRVARRGLVEANVLIPAIVRLPEREAQFYWLGAISSRRGMLFRLKSRPEVQPHTLAEVRGYRTAVIKDPCTLR